MSTTIKQEWFTQEDAAAYQSAQPFPNGVFDGLFDDEMLRAAERSFPGPFEQHWSPNAGPFWHRYDNPREGKLEVRHKMVLPPDVQAVIDIMNGEQFVASLRLLTGISDLFDDKGLGGGGMHMIEPGGRLHVHIDFNKTGPDTFRRLNCLLFLNEGWQESWRGDLQLWDRGGLRKRIYPTFNRLAMFSTSDSSWHGHPEPLACPQGRFRKSIATYYYSHQPPPDWREWVHGTEWWDARR
jgi:hypothetical protein